MPELVGRLSPDPRPGERAIFHLFLSLAFKLPISWFVIVHVSLHNLMFFLVLFIRKLSARIVESSSLTLLANASNSNRFFSETPSTTHLLPRYSTIPKYAPRKPLAV